MKSCSLVLLTLISVPALAGSAMGSQPTVLLGQVEYLETKTAVDYESDKAVYVHGNTQFLLISVTRVLYGPEISGEVILGVEVDSVTVAGSRKIAGSYLVLDPGVWKKGATILVILRSTLAKEQFCSPLKVTVEQKGSDMRSGAMEKSAFADATLEQHRDAPVLCVSGRDMFPIDGASGKQGM